MTKEEFELAVFIDGWKAAPYMVDNSFPPNINYYVKQDASITIERISNFYNVKVNSREWNLVLPDEFQNIFNAVLEVPFEKDIPF